MHHRVASGKRIGLSAKSYLVRAKVIAIGGFSSIWSGNVVIGGVRLPDARYLWGHQRAPILMGL